MDYNDLLYENESNTIDFKKEQYKFPKGDDKKSQWIKSEFLKDMLAFANAPRRTSAFILVGVKEIKGKKAKVYGISDHLDDADLQQFVNKKTQIPIEFRYFHTTLEGETVGVFEITHTQRPVYLVKDYGSLKKETVYYRMSSNTEIATPADIYAWGKKETVNLQLPSLHVDFYDLSTGDIIKEKVKFISEHIDPRVANDAPDNIDESEDMMGLIQSVWKLNKNYYKRLAKHHIYMFRINKLYVMVSNDSDVVAKNVRLDIKLESNSNYSLIESEEIPKLVPYQYNPMDHNYLINQPDINIKEIHRQDFNDKVLLSIEIGNLSPKTAYRINEPISIITSESSEENMQVNLECRVYGENIPNPISKTLIADFEIVKSDKSYQDVYLYHKANYKED